MNTIIQNTQSTLDSLKTGLNQKYNDLQVLQSEADYLYVQRQEIAKSVKHLNLAEKEIVGSVSHRQRMKQRDAALNLIQMAMQLDGYPQQTSFIIGQQIEIALQLSRPSADDESALSIKATFAAWHRKGILTGLTYETASLHVLHYRCKRVHVPPFDRLPLRSIFALSQTTTPKAAIEEVAAILVNGRALAFEEIKAIIARHREANGIQCRVRKPKGDRPAIRAANLDKLARLVASLVGIATTEADLTAIDHVKALIERAKR